MHNRQNQTHKQRTPRPTSETSSSTPTEPRPPAAKSTPHRPTLIPALTAAFTAASMLASTPAQADPARQNPFNTVQQLGRALVIVENHYVQPVDRTKLVEGAVKGMVAELDPHSVYMNRAEYESFRNETEGSFVGIGVEVDMRDNLPTIIRPIDGSPAERAGLQPADQIVAIDGWYTNGKPLDTILQRIRGQRGTSVRLHIRRPGVDKPIAVTIIRADVHVRSVVAQRLDGNIAYIIIKQFQRGTHTEFLQAIGKLRLESDSRLEGLILDLRTNPGGLVHESVQIADELLDSGTIFSTRARGRVLDQIVASSGGAACQLPLAVIVNELTASAAELVAGAIQDNQRGVIVGAPTFGKGSVQSIIELPDGAALKLTTTLYFTPQGRSIQALGITPNVIVNQPGPNSGLPVVREQDIDGHILSPERDPTEPDTAGVTTSEIVVPKEAPSNPIGAEDKALSVAYQMMVERIAERRTQTR